MAVLLFFVISYLLTCITLYTLFVKAGEEGWKALVPGLNFVVWNRLIGDKPWRVFLLLFPIVNIFVWCGMCVDMVRSFGKYRFWHSALAVIFPPAMFFLIGKNVNDKYEGPNIPREADYHSQLAAAHERNDKIAIKKLEANNPYKKGVAREWTESIVFAVFAAAFIRMFLIEMYVIPTSSMEGSLLIGDYLCVSKAHYGMRMPMTVAQVPLLHNTLPFGLGESYTEKLNLPYYRLPKITNIENNDPVVFNYPEGDSVYITPNRTFGIYDAQRAANLVSYIEQKAKENPSIVTPSLNDRLFMNQQISSLGQKLPLVTRPMDKEDFYIKRCVGIPGDKLQIINKQLYINGKEAENPKELQYNYRVTSTSGALNLQALDELGINITDNDYQSGIFNLSVPDIEKIKSLGSDIKIEPYSTKDSLLDGFRLFPHDPIHFSGWDVDNYGPIVIPKQGATIQIGAENIALYRRIIGVYEHNKFEEKDGKIYINGKEATSYTFQQDYYWMMGDNRHNSEDSRFWGFVPADHIVGKPLFIWFSTKNNSMSNGINWGRIFTGATKM